VPLRRSNGELSKKGFLTADSPLERTHAPSNLWWYRYPRVAGYVEPWTLGGRLRGGLTLSARQHHGWCVPRAEATEA
jgi:hypothetical protein